MATWTVQAQFEDVAPRRLATGGTTYIPGFLPGRPSPARDAGSHFLEIQALKVTMGHEGPPFFSSGVVFQFMILAVGSASICCSMNITKPWSS